MEVIDRASLEKPVPAAASLADDPDQGLTEEERAAIVSFHLLGPRLATNSCRTASCSGNWTSG